MVIRNRTKNSVLSENATVARTLAEKITGLLKESVPKAMVFRTRWGIHTIGMRFPIDCVVCDASGHVRALRKNVEPGRFFMWNPSWYRLAELPAGVLAESQTEIGDELEFSERV